MLLLSLRTLTLLGRRRVPKPLSRFAAEHKLNRSRYATQGMNYVFPVCLILLVLIWALFGLNGIMPFLYAGIFIVPFIIILLCYARICTKVTNSIKHRNFYIVKDEVIDKIHKPGDGENSPEYFFVFQNHGKYRLTFDEEKIYNTADSCYLLIPVDSKKIRLVFNSNSWKICHKDFSFNNGAMKERFIVRRIHIINTHFTSMHILYRGVDPLWR